MAVIHEDVKSFREESNPRTKSLRRPRSSISRNLNMILEDDFSIPWHVVNPDSSLKKTWDVLILLLVLYNTITLPYYVGFDVEPSSDVEALEYAIDAVFLIDIFINFRTATIKKGMIRSDCVSICRYYMKSWFLIDMLAILPLELFVVSDQVQILAALKCIRLLRIGRFIKIMSGWGNPNMWRLVRLFFVYVCLAHWIGCGWSLVTGQEESHWMYAQTEDLPTDRDRYTICLYTGFILLVGEDIGPITKSETIYCMVMSMIGALVYATIFGNMALLVGRFNRAEELYEEKIAGVQGELERLELPDDTRDKVLAYYEYLYHNNRAKFCGTPYLDELSPSLHLSVHGHATNQKMKEIDFLRNASHSFLNALTAKLQQDLFMKGATLFEKGAPSTAMYFILEGEIRKIAGGAKGGLPLFARLSNSNPGYFEQQCLLQDLSRAYTAKCSKMCVIRTLSVDDFREVLSCFPDDLARIQRQVSFKVSLRSNSLSCVLQELKLMATQEEKMQIGISRGDPLESIEEASLELESMLPLAERRNIQLPPATSKLQVEAIEQQLVKMERVIERLDDKLNVVKSEFSQHLDQQASFQKDMKRAIGQLLTQQRAVTEAYSGPVRSSRTAAKNKLENADSSSKSEWRMKQRNVTSGDDRKQKLSVVIPDAPTQTIPASAASTPLSTESGKPKLPSLNRTPAMRPRNPNRQNRSEVKRTPRVAIPPSTTLLTASARPKKKPTTPERDQGKSSSADTRDQIQADNLRTSPTAQRMRTKLGLRGGSSKRPIKSIRLKKLPQMGRAATNIDSDALQFQESPASGKP